MDRGRWDADAFTLAHDHPATVIHRGRCSVIALRAACTSPRYGQLLRIHDADAEGDLGDHILSFLIEPAQILSAQFHRPLVLSRGLALTIPIEYDRPEDFGRLDGDVAVERDA